MTFDITQAATWVPVIAGVIIPFVVAYLTKSTATGTVKAVISAVAAALTSLGLYLADVDHVHTWAGAASTFLLAVIMAAASRKTLTDHWVQKVQDGPSGVIG